MQRVLQVEKCCSTAVRTKLIEVGAGARPDLQKGTKRSNFWGFTSCPSKFPQYLFFLIKGMVGSICCQKTQQNRKYKISSCLFISSWIWWTQLWRNTKEFAEKYECQTFCKSDPGLVADQPTKVVSFSRGRPELPVEMFPFQFERE